MRWDRSFRRTLMLASVLTTGTVPLALAQNHAGTPSPNFTGSLSTCSDAVGTTVGTIGSTVACRALRPHATPVGF